LIGNLTEAQLAELLDQKVEEFNQPGFIENDPISIPHSYSLPQDIEITGFWTAILAWGQRKTIINKCQELFGLMDHSPFDFIVNHQESDLKRFGLWRIKFLSALPGVCDNFGLWYWLWKRI